LTLAGVDCSKPNSSGVAAVRPIRHSMGAVMSRTLRAFAILALAFSIGACTPPPPPPSADIVPPAKKKLDAKTQLETGKTY
jgi:hypothetical protein